MITGLALGRPRGLVMSVKAISRMGKIAVVSLSEVRELWGHY